MQEPLKDVHEQFRVILSRVPPTVGGRIPSFNHYLELLCVCTCDFAFLLKLINLCRKGKTWIYIEHLRRNVE